jgi:hypothetical protein
MKDVQFRTFSELYRAAYAEPNPEKKALLLSEVRKALDEWERGLHQADVPIGPKTSQVTDALRGRATLAA